MSETQLLKRPNDSSKQSTRTKVFKIIQPIETQVRSAMRLFSNCSKDDADDEYENNTAFLAEFVYELRMLPKCDVRFIKLKEFGEKIVKNCKKSGVNIRPGLKRDENINKLCMLLLDLLAYIDDDDFDDLQLQFKNELFPVQTIVVPLGRSGDVRYVSRRVITTGDLRAILFGLLHDRRHETVQKMTTYLNGLNDINLIGNEGFVCVATLLIELLYMNNIRVRPTDCMGIGVFANRYFPAVPLNVEGVGQRICVGLMLRSKCMETMDHNYLQIVSTYCSSETNRGETRLVSQNYAKSIGNRGLFGVLYACNASVNPNAYCGNIANVVVCVMRRDRSTGVSGFDSNFVCQLGYLYALGRLKKGRELFWNYDYKLKIALHTAEVGGNEDNNTVIK